MLLFSDVSLYPDLVDYVPKPLGIWPLSKSTGPKDVSDYRWPTSHVNVGFTSQHVISSLVGNALFAADVIPGGESYMDVAFESVMTSKITVIMWLKNPPLSTTTETVLLDFSNVTDPVESNFMLKWKDGKLSVSFNGTTEFMSLDLYKYSNPNQHQMVGFTFDGENNRGTFFTDEKYGYRDGAGTDHIVSSPVYNT